MKKFLKITALILTLALSLSLGFACGGNGGNEPAKETSSYAVSVAYQGVDRSNVRVSLKYSATESGEKTEFNSGDKIAQGSYVFVTITNFTSDDDLIVSVKNATTGKQISQKLVSGSGGNPAGNTQSLNVFQVVSDVTIQINNQ